MIPIICSNIFKDSSKYFLMVWDIPSKHIWVSWVPEILFTIFNLVNIDNIGRCWLLRMLGLLGLLICTQQIEQGEGAPEGFWLLQRGQANCCLVDDNLLVNSRLLTMGSFDFIHGALFCTIYQLFMFWVWNVWAPSTKYFLGRLRRYWHHISSLVGYLWFYFWYVG